MKYKGYKILEMIDKGEIEEGTIIQYGKWHYVVRANSIGNLSVYKCGFKKVENTPPKGQIRFISREMINKDFEIVEICICEKEAIMYVNISTTKNIYHCRSKLNYCPLCGRKLNNNAEN